MSIYFTYTGYNISIPSQVLKFHKEFQSIDKWRDKIMR